MKWNTATLRRFIRVHNVDMASSSARSRIVCIARIVLVAPLFLLAVPAQAQNTKRLILNDGSYQLATKWEKKDDRVRFFSAERNEWEEIPNALVDWDATKKWEEDRAAGKESKEAAELEKEMQEEREEEELRSPHVAAGLRLPPEGGVYALDTYLALPELVPLDQSTGEVNRHTGHNVLRAAINPLAGAKGYD